MAGEYLIKVKAVLDQQDARKMEEDLNGRFNRVADKFGQSMRRGLKRLAVSGILTTAVGLMLNDIDKLNSAIDETLDKYRDIKTKANAQNLTPAEFFKLSELSKMAGVNNFEAIFTQFRQEMEKANRGMPSPLAEFKGQSPDAQTFLQVLTSLQRTDPRTRQLATSEIFGANVNEINKLLTTDLNSLAAQAFTGISDDAINQAIQRGGILSQKQMIAATRREFENLKTRSNIISPALLSQQDTYLRSEQALTNRQLGSYKTAADVQTLMLKGQEKLVEGSNKTVNVLTNFYNKFTNYIDRVQKAREDVRAGRMTQEEYDIMLEQGVWDE
uniref:Uncharacterized protein n=1 Tax=Dulem virus 29 TaxID=3145747 RepID=A0AAU8B1N8_9CAUD